MDTTADASQGWMTSGPGAQRRILCQDKALMMVEFMFEKDGVGVPHSHPHVQTTFVSSGQFEFTVGGDTQILNPGDALIIPSNVEHSCLCLQAGKLLDRVLCILDMGAHGGAGFGLIPRDDRGEDAAVFLLDKLHPLARFAERQVPRQVKASQDVRLHRGARSCEILVAGRLADRLMKGLVRFDAQLPFANAAVQLLEMRAQLGQIRFCMAHGGEERRLPLDRGAEFEGALDISDGPHGRKGQHRRIGAALHE